MKTQLLHHPSGVGASNHAPVCGASVVEKSSIPIVGPDVAPVYKRPALGQLLDSDIDVECARNHLDWDYNARQVEG